MPNEPQSLDEARHWLKTMSTTEITEFVRKYLSTPTTASGWEYGTIVQTRPNARLLGKREQAMMVVRDHGSDFDGVWLNADSPDFFTGIAKEYWRPVDG